MWKTVSSDSMGSRVHMNNWWECAFKLGTTFTMRLNDDEVRVEFVFKLGTLDFLILRNTISIFVLFWAPDTVTARRPGKIPAAGPRKLRPASS